jgi:hypothetical protein
MEDEKKFEEAIMGLIAEATGEEARNGEGCTVTPAETR